VAKFQPGTSGNPKGRPKGIPDRRQRLQKVITEQGEAVISKVVELALDGDIQALRVVTERLIPPLKATDEPVKFALATSATLSDTGNAILHAAAAGKLTPAQAQALLAALASQSKIIEVDDLTKRIEALETNESS